MDDIDFLPEAYRRKCQKKRWAMRRIYFSVLVACMLTVFIAWDQQRMRRLRVEVLPRMNHRMAQLDNTQLLQTSVREKLQQISQQREQVYITLLRASRSRVLFEIVQQAPGGTAVRSISLVTQPEVWFSAPLTCPKDADQKLFELEKIGALCATSELRLSLTGSATNMDDINLYEDRLLHSGLFTTVTLQETRQNGDRFDFSFMVVVTNPYHSLNPDDNQLADVAPQTPPSSPLQPDTPSTQRLPLKPVSTHQQPTIIP